jgi:hypothetical protein
MTGTLPTELALLPSVCSVDRIFSVNDFTVLSFGVEMVKSLVSD